MTHAKTVAYPKEEPIQKEETGQRTSDPMRKLMEAEKNQYNFMVNIQRQNHDFKCKPVCKQGQSSSKKKEEVPESDEEEVHEQDMEPAGDLETHAEAVEKYQMQFAELKELNYLWQRGKQDAKKECYDDLACMCLEWNYWQYLKGGPNQEKHRFVHFVPTTVVDMECFCETDVQFNETGVECERCGEADAEDEESSQQAQRRERPYSLFKAVRPQIKAVKRKKGKANNPHCYKEKNMAWFSNTWYKMNG